MTSSTDTNNKTVNYVYNHQLQLIQKNYEGINIDYEYNEYALLQKVKENNQEIASYMYNARGEVILLTQKDITTSRGYDEMGKPIRIVIMNMMN